jgi:dsDNA-specific endonuclease/ATPase MutS2
MKFKAGDTVRFLDEKGEGVIRGFRGKQFALVEIEDGFEIPYLISQLVKIKNTDKEEAEVEDKKEIKSASSNDIKGVKKIILEKEIKKEKGPKYSKAHKTKKLIVEEVDLHIENLLDNYRGLSNAEIINIQLNKFISKLDSAIRRKIDRIVFIHGVGEGVLKAEIRKILTSYSGIEFYDASYARYGFGATEVVIR